MKTLNFKSINKLMDKNYNICIETGTFMAESTIDLAKLFGKVYTIELDKKLYENATEKCKNIKNIKTMYGNSSDLIKDLIIEINKENSKTLFYLDAHWSGDDSVNWEKSSWEGYNKNTAFIKVNHEKYSSPTSSQQVPLDKEINEINNNYINECIIYIDDFQNFNIFTLKGLKNVCFEGEDWSHMNFGNLLYKLSPRILKLVYLDDQLIIKLLPKAKACKNKIFKNIKFFIFRISIIKGYLIIKGFTLIKKYLKKIIKKIKFNF
tara:strand:- start:3579 stop:4370 length:792 start_codon:yes stop_codon:yes gene_type:complete